MDCLLFSRATVIKSKYYDVWVVDTASHRPKGERLAGSFMRRVLAFRAYFDTKKNSFYAVDVFLLRFSQVFTQNYFVMFLNE